MSNFGLNNPKSAFGELLSVEPRPVIQLLGTSGLTEKTQVSTIAGGSVIGDGSEFICQTGTGNGFASITSRKTVSYRAGQGASARFTTRFTEGVALNTQLAGVNNSGNGFNFGYNGTDFGIMFRHDGESEIQELTITTPAGGAENATVTVNGTGYTVPLTSGTVQHNASEIADSMNTQAPNFLFTQNDDQVVMIDRLSRVIGSMAFTSSTAVAAWVQINAGVVSTDTFINQADWNRDIKSDLIPENGNVYGVQWQYLGYGAIDFFIEDNTEKALILVHRIEYANTEDHPSVTSPNFVVGWTTYNFGNTTNITLVGASAAAFNEGPITPTAPYVGESNTLVGAGLIQTPIISIRNRIVSPAGKKNRIDIDPVFIKAFTDSSKGALIRITINGTLVGSDWAYKDKAKSYSEIDTSASLVTGGRTVDIPVPPNGSETVDLSALKGELLANDTITISGAVVATPASDITVSLLYQEDF